jgi:hypothetical protein
MAGRLERHHPQQPFVAGVGVPPIGLLLRPRTGTRFGRSHQRLGYGLTDEGIRVYTGPDPHAVRERHQRCNQKRIIIARRTKRASSRGQIRQGGRGPNPRARLDQRMAAQPADDGHRPQGQQPLVHNG